VEETTIESVARTNNLYQSGSTYKPFQVALGQNQVIVGFEKGLMGMKKGEKKTIKVIPSEGYGRPVVVPKEQIAPEFSITRDKSLFADTVTQTIEKSKFPSEMQAQVMKATVGETLKWANNAVATVTAVTKDTLTLAIANTGNPFYKKSLKVGATATTETANFRITDISGTGVTVLINNKQSPFFGKKFAVGESATPPQASKITVTAIDNKTVTILADHKFATKDLYFDVEIVDIQ
jgi:FKBP-type peptidyl-prolyl cis-trans isomerase 2